MKVDRSIFREYDIRGVFNEQFDLDFAECLARAYSTYARKTLGKEDLTVSIGYDARLSSPEIAERVAKGLKESGIQVRILGLVTSPISYFSTFAISDIDGSIMITGSHNPPEYNGFKISVGPRTIYGPEIQELMKLMESEEFSSGDGSISDFDIFPTYLKKYKEEFGNLSDLKVVLDCGNGAAGSIVRALFETVGLKPTILFEEPDGTFPNHHPDPTVEKNLKDLQAKVKEVGAVVGIGFDGDADRIGVVDHNGKPILGDELMMIYARDILPQNPGAKVVGDVKCSDRMYAEIAQLGGEPIMWKTGHSLIKQKIKDESAPFGGELSGHIFFADRNFGYDDAPYAALRLVEILSKTGKNISELMEGIPGSFNTPEIRMDTTEEKKIQIVDKLRERYQSNTDVKVNTIDGIRISFEEGWALARSSNTQPVLVTRYESTSESGLQKIQSEMESHLKQIESEL